MTASPPTVLDAEALEAARLERERALAAEMFPAEWARALGLPGRKGNNQRARLRKQAQAELILRPLRAAGASCGTCRHYGHVPVSKKRCCEIDSDWQGYAIRKPTDLCTDYDGPALLSASRASVAEPPPPGEQT